MRLEDSRFLFADAPGSLLLDSIQLLAGLLARQFQASPFRILIQPRCNAAPPEISRPKTWASPDASPGAAGIPNRIRSWLLMLLRQNWIAPAQ